MTKYKSSQTSEGALTLTVAQAAEMLGISEYLAWQLVRAGTLPTIRLGRLVRVPRVQLMKLLEGTNENTARSG